jgi:hypothetical protein
VNPFSVPGFSIPLFIHPGSASHPASGQSRFPTADPASPESIVTRNPAAGQFAIRCNAGALQQIIRCRIDLDGMFA